MNFDGQKKVPHFEIPLSMLRNKEFRLWLRGSESALYLYLYSYISRSDEGKNKIGELLFNTYYKKGILAARWDLKTMAEGLGFSEKSTGHISRLLKNMVDKGFIKKHADKLNGRTINVYEFGTHNGDPYKHETLHIFNYFTKIMAEKRLADFLPGNRPISPEESGL